MKQSKLDIIIEMYPDDTFVTASGFDSAIIGVEQNSMRLVYSINDIISELMSQGMSEDEAVEYFEYNVSGAYIGDLTPIYVNTIP